METMVNLLNLLAQEETSRLVDHAIMSKAASGNFLSLCYSYLFNTYNPWLDRGETLDII